jgi:hypothetical protein
MRLSMLKRFVELAHCCRDVQNLHGHVRRLWEKLATKWENRYAELDQLCNPKSNSASMRAAAALRARVGAAGV